MSRKNKRSFANSTSVAEMQEKKSTKGAVKVITPAEKAAKLAAYHASDNYLKVNAVNKETKEYVRTLKGARSVLLAAKADKANSLTENFRKILAGSKKSDLIWKHMEENVRHYASGKVGTHVILQWLRKNETELLEFLKSGK